MSRWLRINEDCIDNPKILKLPEALRWQWVALLCVASKNDGVLPAIDDVALCLRVPEAKAAEFITKLVTARLIDRVGDHFVPHNWTKRQFKSDSSTERVKRFRNKKGNVSGGVTETVTETAPEAEAKPDTEQSTADARELDEIGLKQEGLLKAAFIAECVNRQKAPDMSIIRTWLLDGIAMGTISITVPPIIRRKRDMTSLSYCDAAVREAHAKSPATDLQVVSQKVFVEVGTLAWTCWCQWHRDNKRAPPIQRDTKIENVIKTGWWFDSEFPPGYDEATGERIAPSSDDEAAA